MSNEAYNLLVNSASLVKTQNKMLKNYLLIAWRNILKYRGFTAINIIGLSLSMSVCLVIISLIYDHYQYDKFHPQGENTYRIVSNYKGRTGIFSEGYATSPLPFGKKLNEEFAAVENYTNLSHRLREGELRSPHKIIKAGGLFADEQFFNVFGFELIEGNPETVLKKPFSIVIMKDLAEKLFPEGDAMGSLIEFSNHGSYLITGIVKKPEEKSHIDFEVLASFSTMKVLKEKNIITNYSSWENVWTNYNYLVINNPSQVASITEAINQIGNENIELEDEEHPGYEFHLQAVPDIVPGKILSNEISFPLPGIILMFFGFLGVIVITTASINYTNLSIAKSINRMKEIGIRKANGASKFQIVLQFLIESVFIAVLSLGGAIIIYKYLVGEFNELWIFSEIGVEIEDNWTAYLYFIVFSLLLGLFTGIVPSLFLSKIDIVQSLKGQIVKTRNKKGISKYFSGKKILTGIQFGFATILLISIFLLKDQGNFLIKSDYGFDEEHVFFMELQNHDPEIISNEFSKIPGVENVTFTSHHPAVGTSHGEDVKVSPEDEEITVYHFSVDENYLEVMDIELAAGTGFPDYQNKEHEKFIVINETAVERLDLSSPAEAIGQVLIFDDSLRLQVTGVVKD